MIVAHAPSKPNPGSWPAPAKTGIAGFRRADATIALARARGYSIMRRGIRG
ncbi:MAG: hypothetical protein HW375_840 [Anaerolineales bacterium]|nr:hypothetical protein [Anaerolineales bacterium]